MEHNSHIDVTLYRIYNKQQLKFTKINEKLFCKCRLIVAIQDSRAFFTDDVTVITLDGIHHLQNVFYFKHQTELILSQSKNEVE